MGLWGLVSLVGTGKSKLLHQVYRTDRTSFDASLIRHSTGPLPDSFALFAQPTSNNAYKAQQSTKYSREVAARSMTATCMFIATGYSACHSRHLAAPGPSWCQ